MMLSYVQDVSRISGLEQNLFGNNIAAKGFDDLGVEGLQVQDST